MFQQEDREPQAIGKILENPDTMKAETLSEQLPSPENLTKALSHWRESRITDRHKLFKPENSASTEWNEQWIKLKSVLGNGIIAVLIGNRGAGKTQMAVCAIREMCRRAHPAQYVKALNFFLDIRETYQNKEKSENEIINKYCAPKLLVIDAVENRSESAFENLLLNHLIDMRYDQVKDTILIGNQTESEFAASMGPSIVDRIHECGIKIICNWKSFRRI